MSPSLSPLATMLSLNTDLLLNCLDGLSGETAVERLHGRGNSISFIAAHMIDARHFMARLLGSPLPNAIGEALATARSIEDAPALPSLDCIRGEWTAISRHLEKLLKAPVQPDLGQAAPQSFPIPDGSLLGGLCFLVQHDAFHLGQVALLRRQFGYEAMSYARRVPFGGGEEAWPHPALPPCRRPG
ncbi:MAG: DinB family protein [Holophagaceae bacterium]|nr:DinB family protein [Holophagaceae bacterium]